jgi:WD40 repeat protein
MFSQRPLFCVIVAVLLFSAGLGVAKAASKHPAEEMRIKSPGDKDGRRTSITLRNKSGKTVNVYWIDFTGERKLYGTLRDGEDYQSGTYVCHPWLVTDEADNPLSVYYPTAEPLTADITAPKEAAIRGGPTKWLSSVVFSPDGKSIASGAADDSVRLWNAADREPLRSFEGHTAWVTKVVFTPDGKSLISASADKTLRLWDVATGKEIRRFAGHTDLIHSVVCSPDGRAAASAGSDGTVRIWDLATGKEIGQLRGFEGAVYSVAYSPDGKTLATGSSDLLVRTWDAASGMLIREFAGHEHYVLSVAYSPDGKTLASASGDATIRFWDAALGKEVRQCRGYRGVVHTLAFSPDGRTLAGASWDGTTRLWEVGTGKPRSAVMGQGGSVCGVAWSADGRLLTTANLNKTIEVVDRFGATAVPTDNLADEQLDQLCEQSIGAESERAYRAQGRLVGESDRAVKAIRRSLKNLRDDKVDSQRIAALIKQLDDDRFDAREEASNQLAGMGEKAASAISEALEQRLSAEVRLRLNALKSTGGDERRFPGRFVETLEFIGTSEAKRLLGEIAKEGSNTALRSEAEASLKRLDKK